MAIMRAIAAVLVLMVGVAVFTIGGPSGSGVLAPLAPPSAQAGVLTPFSSCDELLERYRALAHEQVGPWGLGFNGGGFGWRMQGDDVGGWVSNGMAAAESAAADSTAGGAAPAAQAASSTNVQEVGIDEPDTVKTDGRFLYAVARGRLQVVDVRAAAPQLVADVALPGYGGQLLLDGERLLVLSQEEAVMPAVAEGAVDARIGFPAPGATQLVLSLYDVAEGTPQLRSRLALDGSLVSARVVDGRAQVVLRSHPTLQLPPLVWQEGMTSADEQAAIERNRQLIREAGVDAWLPSYALSDAAGAPVEDGQLLDCASVHHDDNPRSLATLSVLTLDLAQTLAPQGAAGIMAEGETVSATDSRLYVAVGRWPQVEPLPGGPIPIDPGIGGGGGGDVASMIAPVPSGPLQTDIHAFDLTGPSGARYVASGTVEGRLLNQFAMSEHDGVLRVGVTTGEAFAGPQTGAAPSQSSVVTLRESGDDLVELGRIDGLGVTEQIQAIRFLDDIAYVVTFRQTDPLYTVDLSDPAQPRVRGQLKIPGYSAYLYPLEELAPGLLLGVGQDATADGATTGLQVSLFDVADLDAPQRLATAGLPGASRSATSNRETCS